MTARRADLKECRFLAVPRRSPHQGFAGLQMAAKPAVSLCSYRAICPGLYFEFAGVDARPAAATALLDDGLHVHAAAGVDAERHAAAVFGNLDHIFCPGCDPDPRSIAMVRSDLFAAARRCSANDASHQDCCHCVADRGNGRRGAWVLVRNAGKVHIPNHRCSADLFHPSRRGNSDRSRCLRRDAQATTGLGSMAGREHRPRQ